MKTDLLNIKNMCEKYLTESKLLIVPNISIKGQIQKTLADEGIFSANLFMKTVDELAYDEVSSRIYREHYTVIDKNGVEDVIHDVLFSLKNNKELFYFNVIEITKGLVKVIASTILEIKYAGYNFGKIKFELVDNKSKKKDLIKIIDEYNKYLIENKCLDLADVIELAIKKGKLSRNVFSKIYVLEKCQFTWIENEFLKCLNCEKNDIDDSGYLDYKSKSKHINEIIFKKTYGDNSEIKEVLRTIINNKIPFDKVHIVGLNSEPYTQLLYQQLAYYLYDINEKQELPITFGAGISVAVSKPAQFIMELAKEVSEGNDIYEKFPNLPKNDENGLILVDDFVIQLKAILKEKYADMTSDIDNEGYEAILNELEKMVKGRELTLVELMENILDYILDIRILTSAPRAGKIHFTTFNGAEWARREYTFLVGMDVLRFPTNINQNPILLDYEREATLVKSKDLVEKNIKNISRFLESILGKLYVSYSYFDTIQNRENYPSNIFNALIENMAEKTNMADYDYAKEHIVPVNLAIGNIASSIDESDYILNIASNRKKEIKEENIVEQVVVDIKDFELDFSPSSLKTYLDCKYKYYLKYILKLQPLMDEESEKLGWLANNEVGKLYHKIFEEFINKVINNDFILSSEDVAVDEIKSICDIVIKQFEEELPTQNEYQANIEKENILKNCIRFAKQEIKNKEELRPLLTEYRFGKNKTCKIDIDGESIFINGVIDRVDLVKSSNEVKIIDYKTGRSYGYDILNNKDVEVINSKSIQQTLYYLALKEIAKNSSQNKIFDNISKAEYYFVTQKGDYDRYIIDFSEDSEAQIKEELSRLIAQIRTGNFSKDENSKCKYCEYSDACKYKGGDN